MVEFVMSIVTITVLCFAAIGLKTCALHEAECFERTKDKLCYESLRAK
jgi:hypothetical protein